MARELELPHRSFALDNQATIVEGLKGIRVVLHCAGPYSATAMPMLDACIAQRVHYVELACAPDFTHNFATAMYFPNAEG